MYTKNPSNDDNNPSGPEAQSSADALLCTSVC